MRTIFKLFAVAIPLALLAPRGQAQPVKQDPEKVLAAALKNIKLKDKLDIRTQAAMDLADFGPKAEAAVPDLLDCLQIKNEDLRLNAAIALGKIGKAAVPAVAKLLTDKDIDTRYYAVFTLAAIGPDAKETLPALIKMASAKNPDGIRRKAVYALGRLAGDPDATIEALVKACKDPDDDVRQAAGDALAKFGKTAVPHLLELLKEKNAAVRLQAATSLGDIGADAKEAVPALKERYLVKDSDNVHHYAGVLGKIGKPALPALEAGFKDERAEVRQAASLALQQLGGDGVGILVDALGAKNVEVRRLAALTLWPMRIGDKSVVIALAYALSDADTNVRQHAMQALAQLGPQAKLGGPKIRDALIDMNPNVRIQAFYLLQQIGEDPRSILKKALASKDDKIRINTASLMVNVGFEMNDAIPILSEALKHDNVALKMQAAFTLAQRQLQVDQVLPVLVGGLQDKSTKIRLQAVQGFFCLSNHAAGLAPKLAESLADPDLGVRYQAIYAMQSVRGDPEAVMPVLTAIFNGGNADGRDAALQVAGLYGAKAKGLIFAGLKHKDVRVRAAAVGALQNLQGDLNDALPFLVALSKDLLKDEDALAKRQEFIKMMGRHGAAAPPRLPDLHEQTIWVMCRCGAPATPHLADLLKDGDTLVRLAAIEALRNIGGAAAAALPALRKLTNDPNQAVQSSAHSAIQQIEPKKK